MTPIQKPKSYAIVGSGFLGMTLALRLAESGAKITIFESAAEIGGLASAWQIGDHVWDKHYHVTLASDTYTRRIVEELGLGDEFRWVETKTGFYTDGKLYSMSDTMEFLKFPPLGIVGKLRLGATIFYASRQKDWKALENIPVEVWLTKLSGKRTFEKIWKPLLIAKLGDAYKITSAAFIWATIQRMYAARRSGLKKEMFGYVSGGYSRVLKHFAEKLTSKGVEIRLESRIERIEKQDNGKVRIIPFPARRKRDKMETVVKKVRGRTVRPDHVNFRSPVTQATSYFADSAPERSPVSSSLQEFQTDRSTLEFDQVILTCPSKTAAHLLPQLNQREREGLENIRYQGIVCASVLMKCSLSSFYVTNITDVAPFTGVIEMTALVDKREFGHNTLVYLPKYVGPDDKLFEKSDDEIREVFLSALDTMYPHFRIGDVLAFKVSRVRQVFPLPVLDYSESLPSVETSIENVFVLNSSHIVNGTLNVNETIQLAENFFAELKAEARAAASA